MSCHEGAAAILCGSGWAPLRWGCFGQRTVLGGPIHGMQYNVPASPVRPWRYRPDAAVRA